MLNLLSKINNDNTRTHYISYCAQLLGRGNEQLRRQVEESFITQVKRQQRSVSKKQLKNKELPALTVASDRNLLEQAEALLLRIYLHCPEYRQTIIDTLEEHDLLFTLSHHRFLWQQILELQPVANQTHSNTRNDLISLLQDRSFKFPDQMAQVAHLFHLDEKRQEDITRAPLVIRAAAACIEIATYEKHRRYCLEQWQKLDPSTDLQRKQYYWQEFCEATQRLQELEQIRQVTVSDVGGLPTL
jgi:DNA primase